MGKKWSDAEEELLLELYDEGMDDKYITKEMNAYFHNNRTIGAVRARIAMFVRIGIAPNRYTILYEIAKNAQKSGEQTQPIQSSPPKSHKVDIESAAPDDIPPTKEEVREIIEMVNEESNIKPARQNMTWTIAEDCILIKEYGRTSPTELTKKLLRTHKACEGRYRSVKRNKDYLRSLSNIINEPSQKEPNFFTRWRLKRKANKQQRIKNKMIKLQRRLD